MRNADALSPQAKTRVTLGLALSGGGSRAAAFHRGTTQGLSEVGLLDEVDSVSSVSGGSVFAGAWMAALWQGRAFGDFLTSIGQELAAGFIARSIGLRAAKLFLPSYTRSNLLAETFNRTLMGGMQLQHLPERPVLCINTSVMNTGQVGKFSRHGFSSTGFVALGERQQPSNPSIALPEFPVALAATASAAFPIGLPPVYLRRGEHIPDGWGGQDLATHRRFALTDGGVLENLGVQTLLKSKRFGTWDLIISDAGRIERAWEPGKIKDVLYGAMMGAVSLPTLARVTSMMNSKENRHMRISAFDEMERSWMIEALQSGVQTDAMKAHLASQPIAAPRRLLFVRLNQSMAGLLAAIPRWRMCELAARANVTLPETPRTSFDTVKMCGIDLSTAVEMHRAMGGDARIAELNRIGTHFSAMRTEEIRGLYEHARWQVHAMHALYWCDANRG
jgi:predicted acylesterase/phospholipase RssA